MRCFLAVAFLVLSVLGVTRAAAAAIAYVQSSYQDPSSASSVNVKYASVQSAGDLNVVIVAWNDSTSRVNSITDSKGNRYLTAVGPTTQAGNATQVIYYAQNIAAAAAGANTVTVTFNATVKFPDVRVIEYSGISTSGPFDVGVAASGSTGTSLSSGAVTTTNANDLLVGGDFIGAGFAGAGSGYTQRLVTAPDGDLVEDQVATATGSYSATSAQSPSSWWVMQMAAFRAAASSGDSTPPTAPSSLTASPASSTQISVSWTASTDNIGVTGYRVERCSGAGCTGFAQIGTSATTGYSDIGVTPSTSYSYRVRATDAAGNLSAYSNTATAITPAVAAIAYVQSSYQDPSSASSVSVKYASAQSAGDLNLVIVAWNDSTSRVNSITDSKGNRYLVAVGPTTNSGNATQAIYYAQNIAAAAAGANTLTVTFNATVKFPDVRVIEYGGISTSNPFDAGVGASGNGTGPNSGSIMTTNANDLLVGGNFIGSGFAGAGSGYTQRLVTAPDGDLVEDRVVTTTGSYSSNSVQSPSSWWVMQLAAFRAASGASGSGGTSPNGATVVPPSNGTITDSAGNVWTVSGGQIYENGVLSPTTKNVILLMYYNGAIYQQNNTCGVWFESGANWVQAAFPAGVAEPAAVATTCPGLSGIRTAAPQIPHGVGYPAITARAVMLSTGSGEFYYETIYSGESSPLCVGLYSGTLSANGSSVSGSGNFYGSGTLGGLAVGCPGEQSDTFSGTLNAGSSLSLTDNIIGQINWTFSNLYDQPASLAAIAGNWLISYPLDGQGSDAILSISSSGALYMLATSGCTYTGQISVINPSYNLYSVSLTATGCTENYAVLNGLTEQGLATVDSSVTPNVLTLGASVTLPTGGTFINVFDSTRE
jgi:hypothetical protein